MRYCPFALLVAERTRSMSDGLWASTVTPGSTAPEVSRTVPPICCALARPEKTSRQAPTPTAVTRRDPTRLIDSSRGSCRCGRERGEYGRRSVLCQLKSTGRCLRGTVASYQYGRLPAAVIRAFGDMRRAANPREPMLRAPVADR